MGKNIEFVKRNYEMTDIFEIVMSIQQFADCDVGVLITNARKENRMRHS